MRIYYFQLFKMNRRNFLKTIFAATSIRSKKVPKKIKVKPVKNTLNAVKEYDDVVRKVNTQGNDVMSRSTFLKKAKKQGKGMFLRNFLNNFSSDNYFISDFSNQY